MNKYIIFFTFIIFISSCKTNNSYIDDMDGIILINADLFDMVSDDNDSTHD